MIHELSHHCEATSLRRRCEERSDVAIQYPLPTSRDLIAGSRTHPFPTSSDLIAGSIMRKRGFVNYLLHFSRRFLDPAVKPRDVGVRFLVVHPKSSPNIIKQKTNPFLHCEERSDAAIFFSSSLRGTKSRGNLKKMYANGHLRLPRRFAARNEEVVRINQQINGLFDASR
jgi:hypothetical protein